MVIYTYINICALVIYCLYNIFYIDIHFNLYIYLFNYVYDRTLYYEYINIPKYNKPIMPFMLWGISFLLTGPVRWYDRNAIIITSKTIIIP